MLKNSDKFGPYGRIIALAGVAFFIAGCATGGTGITPSATPEITHTPTLTPTPTHSPTLMSAPTFTPANTFTPMPSPTAGPWNFRPSQFEAADNDAGQNVGGVTELVWVRLLAHLDSAWAQIAKYPQINGHQGYAEAMLFSQPAREADGDVIITQKRGPDFWERFGGFGFTSDNANRYPDKSTALAANPADFFKIDADGIGRTLTVVPEADVEFAIFAAARAAVAANYPKEDFSDPVVLKRHDREIKNLVYRAIFTDSGFKPDTKEPWPGANNVNNLTDSFVDGNGVVCVGHRPSADQRNRQLPEIFPKVRYDQDLELRSPGDDETLNRVDSGTGMVVTAIIDLPKKLFRIDIIDGANVRDLLRPEEARPLDKEDVPVRSRLGRWVLCGQGQPGLASPTGGPEAAPSQSPSPQPTGTLKPGEIPQPPQQPPQPPAEITPTPPVPPNTPGAHESTPESGVPTVVPPGPNPIPGPTFIPQPTESAGNATEMVPTPDY